MRNKSSSDVATVVTVSWVPEREKKICTAPHYYYIFIRTTTDPVARGPPPPQRLKAESVKNIAAMRTTIYDTYDIYKYIRTSIR